MIIESSDRERDLLGSTEAGGLAIRGGMLRLGGYAASVAVSLVSVPVLARHLGVEDFGRYVTVLSLITIASMVSDVGLTLVGLREYAVRDHAGRVRLVRNLVGLRTLVSSIGAVGATVFAAAAGYGDAMVLGTALAGLGLVLTMVQQTYTIPLQGDLRLGLVTALDLARHTLAVVAILLLALVGAGLVAFLSIPVPVGVVALAAAALAIHRRFDVRPQFDAHEWRYLAREALPVAIASAIGSFFYRSAIIVLSIMATAQETGYFSASFRIVEAIQMVPALLTASAFPIVARAATNDPKRLAYSLQRLFDMAVILGAWAGLCVVLGAEPAIRFVGGPEYEPAVEVLRVQGIALALSFLVTVWATGLWAVRDQRALAGANAVGVASAVLLTAALIPGYGALGAAIGMAIAETLLAAIYAFALMRGRPHLRPELTSVPKTLAAVAVASAAWFAPVPDLVKVALATVLFFAVLAALRGMPTEIAHALRERRLGRRTA
ncbi:MAG: flippase [Gaiellaceae bacterium]